MLEVVFGDHKHFITRQILWIRELWLDFSINNTFSLHSENEHRFRLGAFPFELGRGIALGSAYAVGPRVLGFFSDNAIDQYAFGFKLYGPMISPTCTYDLYTAILENRMDSFSNTGAKILGQEFGHKFNQARGTGVVDFASAVRVKWNPVKEKHRLVIFEPYALYNYAPEQRIEFPADSSSKLGTIGLAGEFMHNRFEWGFDIAKNFGSQGVKGWDRNMTSFANNAGVVNIVNTEVRQDSSKGAKVLYVPGSDTQKLIDSTVQNASQNGMPIGTVNGTTLYNSTTRFSNPYTNRFEGWMFVADGAYTLLPECKLKIAGTAGYASGDDNPNQDLAMINDSSVNGKFKGFIGLQELYSGYRVQSVFLLGGTGKAPRPLSIPVSTEVPDRLPSTVAGLTNLAFVGSAVHWSPTWYDRSVGLRGNILSYWQTKATNAFDRLTGKSSDRKAPNYIGTELNIFADTDLLTDFDSFKLYCVSSVFIPGSHYKAIKGTPLTRDELKSIDSLDVTGITDDSSPFLSDNVAYTLNVGLELRF